MHCQRVRSGRYHTKALIALYQAVDYRAAVLMAVLCVDARLWAAPSSLEAKPLTLPEPQNTADIFQPWHAAYSRMSFHQAFFTDIMPALALHGI